MHKVLWVYFRDSVVVLLMHKVLWVYFRDSVAVEISIGKDKGLLLKVLVKLVVKLKSWVFYR